MIGLTSELTPTRVTPAPTHAHTMFTAPSITLEHRRIFLIGAAAAAALVLTITVVRLATSSNTDTNTDKPLSKRQLARLSTAERRELTTTLRNTAAAHADESGDVARAAELYTRALAAVPEEDKSTVAVAALYTSRAWCYANMVPPRHREVVADCDRALVLDPRDAMAVLRRSIALQELKATGAAGGI
ncbi:hypothetical protein EI94DRAFT_1748267 [Lactarius quietus]|nr:hypothetical protein EI94DRAFT_1748267 [Lactarius quietus]